MRITSRPNSCKRCFVTIPSATPVVKAYDSASAEQKLTVCCVRDHAVSVAFHHCATPPLVLLHVVAWPAQSLSVCTVTNFGGVMISIRLLALGAPFRYLTIRFKFVSSLSVGHVIVLAVSFTLYMTSARSWHMYNSLPATVLYIARLSPSSSTSDTVVGASSSHSESSQVLLPPNQEHLSRFGCSSDSLPPSILVPFARSLCPRSKICHPSYPFFL